MQRLYTIKREDYFKIPSREKYMLSHAGSLWISMWLTEEEVFLLWCQGIVANPVDALYGGATITI